MGFAGSSGGTPQGRRVIPSADKRLAFGCIEGLARFRFFCCAEAAASWAGMARSTRSPTPAARTRGSPDTRQPGHAAARTRGSPDMQRTNTIARPATATAPRRTTDAPGHAVPRPTAVPRRTTDPAGHAVPRPTAVPRQHHGPTPGTPSPSGRNTTPESRTATSASRTPCRAAAKEIIAGSRSGHEPAAR